MTFTLSYTHSSQEFRRVATMLHQIKPLLAAGNRWTIRPPGTVWQFDGDLSEVMLNLQRELESRMSDTNWQMGAYYLKVETYFNDRPLSATTLMLERP